jgi:type I restriction enzyme M protein
MYCWMTASPFMAYTGQITFLLFFKMADEQTRPPYNRAPIVPPELGWPSKLGAIFKRAQAEYGSTKRCV